jgi:GntR family transcriptional repressor for pyruvate dehydrogenase complex
MPLRAVKTRSLSDQVFEQLGRAIMSGRYLPGSKLPAERALAEIFKVNRHVVREALKRLEQIGVIKISQGGGTRVLDFVRSAGLDALVVMGQYARGSVDESAYWMSMLEMPAAIAADVSRLCARPDS